MATWFRAGTKKSIAMKLMDIFVDVLPKTGLLI